MNQNRAKVDHITIGLASPAHIRKWTERILPNGKKVGEVTNAQTICYKTFRPMPGGLCCERIFGPTKDFECSCGTKPNKVSDKFCPNCEVEFTESRVRRYRLGFIKLAYPVTHIWYLKGRPSFISILLNMKRKEVESIVYGATEICLLRTELVSKLLKTNIKQSSKNSNLTDSNTISYISLLDQYYITKYKNNYNKDTLFQVQLNSLFYNSYYSNLKSIQFVGVFSEFQTYSFSIIKYQNKQNHKYSKAAKKLFLNKSVNTSNLLELKFRHINSANFQHKINTNLDIPNLPLPTKTSGIQPQIGLYYPFLSECLFSDTYDPEYESKLELKYESKLELEYQAKLYWIEFKGYINSDSGKHDFILPSYYSRVFNHYLSSDSIEYKLKEICLTGTNLIKYWLKTLEMNFIVTEFPKQIPKLTKSIDELESSPVLSKFEKRILRRLLKQRLTLRRRHKLVYYFFSNKKKLRPEWVILSILPVLPPNLRPIISLDANQIATSDLNNLYLRVLYRNKRIQKKKNSNFSIPDTKMRLYEKLLQQAVDALLDNGKGGTPLACSENGRPYKSLSDVLKGKKGRFRYNLLGKRVDYSGRSVIVVAPELKLHECGLPKEMAIELFQTFIIRELRKNQDQLTIIKAKMLIQEQDPIIWKILQKILRCHPILLNRAPTLHRLGIQAFQPKLVDGRAILLHPLVCTAFNADFDGDQMGVHVPLSGQARAEAWKLMWSRNNILSPATGQPIIVPSQDMVLGCYYLTTNLHKNLMSINLDSNHEFNKKVYDYFSNLDEVLVALKQKKISLHSLIWVRWIDCAQIENFYEKPLELRIDWYGNSIHVYSKYWRNLDKQSIKISQFILTTPGRVLLNKTVLQNIAK